MSDVYQALVDTGAIGSLKRDILLEASDDLFYLEHIRRWFEDASADAAHAATECTVKVVRELISKGLCQLATWGTPKGSYEILEKTPDDLHLIIDRYKDISAMSGVSFQFFLVTTDAGDQWAARYENLVGEL